MAKKVKAAKKNTKMKKGAKYVCDDCGVVVSVDEPCGCDPCAISCCGTPMRAACCC